jgi:hypothetical protein
MVRSMNVTDQIFDEHNIGQIPRREELRLIKVVGVGDCTNHVF